MRWLRFITEVVIPPALALIALVIQCQGDSLSATFFILFAIFIHLRNEAIK